MLQSQRMDRHVPLPVAHSFAGFLIARFMGAAGRARSTPVLLLGSLIVAANAPDFDFVPGILLGEPSRFHHNGVSHSLLAVGVFALAAWIVARWAGARSPLRIGLLMGLAFASHLVLDMLESWSDERSGVALGWPLVTKHLSFPFPIFFGIRFDPSAGSFIQGLLQQHNFLALGWELVVVGGIWALMRATRVR